jgi:hypothetical protein
MNKTVYVHDAKLWARYTAQSRRRGTSLSKELERLMRADLPTAKPRTPVPSATPEPATPDRQSER